MKKKLSPTESMRKLADAVAEEADADVILYSGAIQEPFDYKLIGKVKRLKARPNAIFLLTTLGGQADAAYRMMRCLQARYVEGKISLFVPHICKSAGSLMAVGSDEIVMSEVGELGPLDVQLRKPDEVGEWASGLTPLQALAALRAEAFNCFEQHFLLLRERSGRQITAKTAAEIAVKLTIGWFQPIYEQLDPMRLSETQRAMMIAREYGMRLARGNISESALDSLISDYPSHEFIIDRDEALRLFKHVRAPSEAEQKLSGALVSSRMMDDGLNSERPTILFLSHEDCNFSADNKWEGIEHEDPDEPQDAERPSDGGPPDGKSNAQPVRHAPSLRRKGRSAEVGNGRDETRADRT